MIDWNYIEEKEYTLLIYNPNLEDAAHFTIKVQNELLKIKAEVALETKYDFKEIKVESICPPESYREKTGGVHDCDVFFFTKLKALSTTIIKVTHLPPMGDARSTEIP